MSSCVIIVSSEGVDMVHVVCEWCGAGINRSPSALSRIRHCFCCRGCCTAYMATVVDVGGKG